MFEVERDETVYVLFGGEWFAVDKAFHKAVEDEFVELVPSTPFVASTTQTNERAFIRELNGNKHLLNLDQVKLSPTATDVSGHVHHTGYSPGILAADIHRDSPGGPDGA